MSIFYINAEKTVDGQEWLSKYDFGKFVDGTSDVPAETMQRVRIAVNMDTTGVSTMGETEENAGTTTRRR